MDNVTPPDDIQYPDEEGDEPISVNQLKASGFKEVPVRALTDHSGIWYFLITEGQKTYWMPLRND